MESLDQFANLQNRSCSNDLYSQDLGGQGLLSRSPPFTDAFSGIGAEDPAPFTWLRLINMLVQNAQICSYVRLLR